MTRFFSVFVICLSFAFGSAALAAEAPAAVKAAVADPARPAADTARDANRKPVDVVAFSGLKAGDKIADVNPGGGYFTRIFAKVVGANGKVYAVPRQANDNLNTLASGYPNVVVHPSEFDKLSVPEALDVAWTSDNYHDFKNRGEGYTDAMNKAIFAALKPGGTYIVIDHAAEKGSGGRDTRTLHRVDPDLVKKEVLAAGFTLDGESNTLANPADDHKAGVSDGAVQGKTDQFVFRFRKPAR